MRAFPTFKQFAGFLEIYKSGKGFFASAFSSKKEIAEVVPVISKWVSIPLYILSFIPVTIFWIIMGIFGLMIYGMIQSGRSRRSIKEKYPSDKYRKVIKEGIFWDSVEYHER